MMSLSFMINSSWPSIVTSVPDHFAEQHAVAEHLHVDRDQLPEGFVAAAAADGDDFALGRSFSLAVSGMMMPPAVLWFALYALDHDAVMERTEFHIILPGFSDYSGLELE